MTEESLCRVVEILDATIDKEDRFFNPDTGCIFWYDHSSGQRHEQSLDDFVSDAYKAYVDQGHVDLWAN